MLPITSQPVFNCRKDLGRNIGLDEKQNALQVAGQVNAFLLDLARSRASMFATPVLYSSVGRVSPRLVIDGWDCFVWDG